MGVLCEPAPEPAITQRHANCYVFFDTQGHDFKNSQKAKLALRKYPYLIRNLCTATRVGETSLEAQNEQTYFTKNALFLYYSTINILIL